MWHEDRTLRAFMTRDGERPRVILAIDTDEGITGWGECYNHGPDRALVPVLDYLAQYLEGQDPRRIEFLMQLMMQHARFPGAIGLAAMSAIDHCLWDIAAKALGVPVYQLLAAMCATGCGSMPGSTLRPMWPMPVM
jgi:galactonate dehydratase